MIFATGTFQNKACDLTPVSVKDVIKELGIPFSGSESVEFTLDASMVRWDELNKTKRFRPRAGKGNTINGRDKNGNTFSLLFTNSAPRKDERTGIVKSDPLHYFYEGCDFLVPAQALEEAVFFYLHPNCKNSPFFNGRAEWSMIDRRADAQKESEALAVITKLITEINTDQDYPKLKRIAKGMKLIVKGNSITIPVSKIGTLEEVRVALSGLAMKYPQDFSLAYRDANVLLAGTVKDAVDSGLLINKGVGGRMSKWYWTIGDKSELCTVNAGVEPFAALLNAVQNRETFLQFINMVDGNANRLEPQQLASIVSGDSKSKEPKNMTGAELVSEALAKGIIEYSREKSAFLLIGPDGEPQVQSLHKVENVQNRLSELVAALDEKGLKRNRVTKAINGDRSEEPEPNE